MSEPAPFCDDVSGDVPTLSNLGVNEILRLYAWQKDILARLAAQEDVEDLLDEICRVAEEMVPDAVASIMLFDEAAGVLNVKSAPSLPPSAISAFNGLKPGPGGGSCGNVVWSKEPQYVCSIATDPRWNDIRDLAVTFHLGACWSHPIHGDGGEVIGTFALTSFETREPDQFQKNILELGAHLAGSVLRLTRAHERELLAAYHDPVTGLPNRQKLLADMEDFAGRPLACFYLDLDHFQQINDVFGQEAGDAVLRVVAARLCDRHDDDWPHCYHLGADAFVLMWQADELSHPALERLAAQLLGQLERPIEWQGQNFHVGASIGIAAGLGDEAETLVRRADAALSRAKQHGRHRWMFFDPAWQEEMLCRVQINMRLQQALQHNLLHVHYQPVVTLNGEPEAFEALVRWEDETLGRVQPEDFVPVAEASGLINALTRRVVEQVLVDLARWQQVMGALPFRVAINLSPLDLTAEQVERIMDRLRDHHLTGQVEFELTESRSLEQNEDAGNLLALMQQEGVRAVAIDDFGSGYASLARIKQLAVDKLKIDQSLVRDLTRDEMDLEIARAAVSMGHALGLKVVAEGVETEAHYRLLRALGVDLLQGYFISPPLAADAVPDWLRQWRGFPRGDQ